MVLLARHAVVHEILVHLGIDPAAVVEVERQEAAGIHQLGRLDRRRVLGMEVFRRLALDEDRVRPHLEDRPHGGAVRLDDVLQRRDEAAVRGQLLVPPAIGGRELRADEHLVHRRVQLHPRKALGEGAGVAAEELGEVGILEVADEVRHAEMAEIDDRRDVDLLQVAEGEVGETPVIALRREPGLVDRRAVAEDADVEVLQQLEIGPPVLVMAALLHLVDALAAVVDGRIAVLDPGREHEPGSCHV